ncbi:hypothetical protein ACFL2V_14915 [Pseudomonadota bacterium]
MGHVKFGARNFATSLIASLMLAGCGGGSGGQAGIQEPTNNSVTGVEFNGTAAKGIIKEGIVTAEEFSSTGMAIADVGQTRTNENGKYQLTLTDNYTGGPIQVTITKDSLTQMKCDVPQGCGTRTDGSNDSNANTNIDFGEWYKPASLTMKAMVRAATEGETISANITPYTHLAAERALSQAELNTLVVAQANSEVSNLLGVDIMTAQLLDITDAAVVAKAGSTDIAYAALASAVATLADVDSNGEPDIGSALNELVDSFAGGRLIADDEGAENDAEIISLQEIIDASAEAFNKMGIADTSTVMAGLTESIANAKDNDGDGLAEIKLQPRKSAGDTNLEKVKAMVGDVRTWSNVVIDQMETPGEAFVDQIELATEAFKLTKDLPFYDHDVELLMDTLENYLFNDGGEDLVRYSTNQGYLNGDTYIRGTIKSPEPGIIEIKDASIWGVDSLDIRIKTPVDGVERSSLEFVVESASFFDGSSDLEITNGALEFNLASPYLFNWDAVEENTADLPDINSVEIDFKGMFTQVRDFNAWQASLDTVNFNDPVTVSASVKTTIYVDTEINEDNGERDIVWATPSNLSIDGTVSNTKGDSFSGTITANISNAQTFAPVSDDQVEDSDNWLDATLGLKFTAQLEDVPKATINLVGDRTGFDTGKVDLTLSFDDRSLVLSANGDRSSDEFTDDISIKNQEGVEIKIQPYTGENEGVITYNGKVYASVYKTDGELLKVSYIDGTFEVF